MDMFLTQMINNFRKNNLLFYFIFSLLISFLTITISQFLLFENLQKRQFKLLLKDIKFKSTLVALGLENLPINSIEDISGIILKKDSNFVAIENLSLLPKKQNILIKNELCIDQQSYCPIVLQDKDKKNYWVEIQSPYEKVWMSIESNNIKSYNNPFQLTLSLIIGVSASLIIFFQYEVNKPLKKLEIFLKKLKVGEFNNWEDFPYQGTNAVKSLINRINKMGKRLKIGEQERVEMLAGIAHDLKSPVARLQMRLGQDIKKNKSSLTDLKSLNVIINKFLIFANSSNQESFVNVPIKEFILELITSYNQIFELDLLNININIQPTALRRALLNLIDNAIQYGEAPYKIEMKSDLQNKELKIIIWDSGRGIPTNSYGKIIEPFTRLDKSRKGSENCGLGLSIVSKIVISHNGKLGFEKDNKKNLFGVFITIKH